MNQILQNKPMSIFGDGSQTRAFSYIGDVAPLIAEAVDNPQAYNEIFNIGADTPYTVNELAFQVAQAMRVEPSINHLPPRHEVLNAYSSHEKIRRIFGERVPVSVEVGLNRMAKWVESHGARQSQIFKDIEVIKNFPQAWLS
jgi:UDP-glucose 4-epimerase